MGRVTPMRRIPGNREANRWRLVDRVLRTMNVNRWRVNGSVMIDVTMTVNRPVRVRGLVVAIGLASVAWVVVSTVIMTVRLAALILMLCLGRISGP